MSLVDAFDYQAAGAVKAATEYQARRELTSGVRQIIYSYLDRSTVLQKISILSTSERDSLVDSRVAAKNKSYLIEVAGQRNAQR